MDTPREGASSPISLDQRLMALYLDLPPADQDAMVVMCERAAGEADEPEVEGFSNLQVNSGVLVPPVLNIHFGNEKSRLQSAIRKNEQTMKLVTRSMRSHASMAKSVIDHMR